MTPHIKKRELKFRYWTGKKMAFDIGGDYGSPISLNEYLETPNLMQYTGRKDANGVEIYEGDIIQNIAKYIGGTRMGQIKIVEWSESIRNCGCCDQIDATGFDLNVYGYDNSRYVIGNIFENPELYEAIINNTK